MNPFLSTLVETCIGTLSVSVPHSDSLHLPADSSLRVSRGGVAKDVPNPVRMRQMRATHKSGRFTQKSGAPAKIGRVGSSGLAVVLGIM